MKNIFALLFKASGLILFSPPYSESSTLSCTGLSLEHGNSYPKTLSEISARSVGVKFCPCMNMQLHSTTFPVVEKIHICSQTAFGFIGMPYCHVCITFHPRHCMLTQPQLPAMRASSPSILLSHQAKTTRTCRWHFKTVMSPPASYVHVGLRACIPVRQDLVEPLRRLLPCRLSERHTLLFAGGCIGGSPSGRPHRATN